MINCRGVYLAMRSHTGLAVLVTFLVVIVPHTAALPPELLQVIGVFPVVSVEDQQQLQFQLPSNVFQLSPPYGQLAYSATDLPAWLQLSSSGMLSGTPQLDADADLNLTIIATDSSGASNSTQLQLTVRAACPAGLYRHFRVRITNVTASNWGEVS